jgi:NADH-ubiquinone oxidoreductase chain 2
MILIMAIALAPQSNSSLDLEQGNNSNSIVSGAGLSGVASNTTESLSSLGQAVSARGGISPLLISRLTSISFLFSGALAYNALYIQSIGSGLSIYSGLFQITVLSQSFDLFIFVLAALILIPWSNGIVKGGQALKPLLGVTGPVVSEYSLIVLFSTLGSSLLLSSGNLLSLYLAVELQSFGVYILATIYRNSESATNAGLKYFLLGGLSSCLILLGCVLIYSYTGLIYFEDIYSLVSSLTLVSDTASHPVGAGYFDIVTVIQLGLILIFIGFLFKIAAAPFHNWAPDVYNDVPTIVTTWLTIMPKIAIVVLAFEILSTITPSQPLELGLLVAENGFSSSFTNLGLGLKNLLLIASFLSLVIGTTVGLAQIKIKRLLAYSTISHVGFLLLALSINTEESLESLLFYLVQYSITNLNTFFILLAFGYILKKSITKAASTLEQVEGKEPNKFDISLISELKGQFWSNPLLSLSLAVSLFSMAGIPPLVGFFAKAQVLYSATQNGYYFISIVAIVVSVISAYYYLQIIKVMHFDSQAQPSSVGQGSEVGITQLDTVNNTHSFIISTLTLSLLLFMLKPSIILNSIHLIALNIFYS